MARKNETPVFKKHQKVAAARDLPGVPAGTPGKVLLIGGYAWVRYRVRFANGVERGMLHAEDLTTAEAAAEQAREAELEATRAARAAQRAAAREQALAHVDGGGAQTRPQAEGAAAGEAR
jgi:hypothetical protein